MHIFYSQNHKLHDSGQMIVDGEPYETDEIPLRAELIRSALEAAGLGPIEAPTDFGMEPILAVHDPDFVEYLATIYTESAEYFAEELPVLPEIFAPHGYRHRSRSLDGRKGIYAFGLGNPIHAGTWTAAYWSAQCALSAARRLQAGDRSAYALCRPPGHHAHANLYGGFCYLNNVAIAARSLGPGVAILDVDFHHGNGTQEIFYRDPGVLFCSLHIDPDEEYPYFWGGADERGEGPGEGYNRNWPLPRDTDEEQYLDVLDAALEVVQAYDPRFLLVSAGFDVLQGDPVGGFGISLAGVAEVGRRIAALGLPTAIFQEGGYLHEALGECAAGFLSPFNSH